MQNAWRNGKRVCVAWDNDDGGDDSSDKRSVLKK